MSYDTLDTEGLGVADVGEEKPQGDSDRQK